MFPHCLLPALVLLAPVTAAALVINSTAPPEGAPKFRPDYTFYEEANVYFKYQEIPANFKEARLRCHLEGATLASPINYELEDALHKLMDSTKPLKGLLTGIHATFSSGDFFSVEGIHLPQIPHQWAENESSNLHNQGNCIKLDSNGLMSVVNCEKPLHYVCYKKAGNYQLNECGTVDNEYHLDSRTGSCYKFHTLCRSWSRAYMTCAAEGGHLAVINSETEAQVIKDLFAKNPDRLIKGADGFTDVANIGFHDWGEHGEWLTIDGESLKEAGYNTWERGQPNNLTTGQFCGAIQRSGRLNDVWCEKHFAFICEKDPKF